MDAAAETLKPQAAKATVDQFTVAANTAFKDGVEKSLAALGEANGYSKKNLEAMVASATAAARGAEAVSAHAVAYSKSAFETQVNAVKALAAAKTPQEALELQTTFAKSAFETYVAEATKFGELLTTALTDSFKPLNERVTETVGKLQATR